MAFALPDGVELELVHPRFAPATLVALKKSIELEAYLAWARALPEDTASRAVVLSDGEGPFAMLMLHFSAMYGSVAVDHFVVAHRKREKLGALRIARIFVSFGLEYAKALGAKRVLVQTRSPKAIRRLARSARVVESVVSLEVA